MVFTTHLFIFYFLPAVLLTYYALPFRWRTGMLALASYAFYGWANPWWVLVMFGSTLVDYTCGLLLARSAGLRPAGPGGDYADAIPKDLPRTRRMKALVAASVVTNLGALGFFKYTGFVLDNVRAMSQTLGFGDAAIPAFTVILPVGISFYTFQSMSYAIDVYRGDAPPMRRLVDFSCYVALFPQLVAGPIVRYGDVAEQLLHRSHTPEKFARGVAFFACGMAKKVLVANPMALVADRAFAADSLHAIDAWFGLVAYSFQIYFDFSGYSDMAVGLGLMMGFLFVKNFDAPYRAESITDFWRRWHISLSTWLRDYVYIPLGGNRLGPSRTYVNLMLVMLFGGLWHGANWTFVIWGAIHGGMLALERMAGKDSLYRALPAPARVGLTFLVVTLAWVFFRAESLPQATAYFASLLGLGGGAAADVAAATLYTPYHLLVFFLAAGVVWMAPQTWRFTAVLSPARATAVMGMLLVAVLFMWTQTANPFIYFQF